jgi:hypothetical protein
VWLKEPKIYSQDGNPVPEFTPTQTVSSAKWRCFQIGFWLLMLSYSALTLTKTRWHINGAYLSAPLLIVGMVLLLFASFQNLPRKLSQLSSLQALLLAFTLAWGVLVALRGLSALSISAIRDTFGIGTTGWAWIIPAFALLSMDERFIKVLFKTIQDHAVVGVILLFTLWLPPVRLYTDFHLLWGCSALLLFWNHLPRRGRYFSLFGAVTTVFFSVLASDRNTILGHCFLMISASFLIFNIKHAVRGKRRFIVISTYVLSFLVIYYVAISSNISFLPQSQAARIDSFKEEMFEDTRFGEKHSLYSDFFDDMELFDLLFGRGTIGSYKSRASGGRYRQNIECGYLQVILKGGIIMLFLMLAMAIPAVIRGFISSRNWVVKGFAFIVTGWLIEMIVFGLPSAFPRYALFWISIGVCHNRRLRKMTNEQIQPFVA